MSILEEGVAGDWAVSRCTHRKVAGRACIVELLTPSARCPANKPVTRTALRRRYDSRRASSSSASARSSVVVTLRLSFGAGTTRPVPPRARPATHRRWPARAPPRARRARAPSAARRNTCGVCTAHRRGAVERSEHTPSFASLLDRVGDWSGRDRRVDYPRASAPRASLRSARALRSGRAASCTSTGSPAPAAASARRTDSERTAPPSTPTRPSRSTRRPPGGATTIRSIAGTARSTSTLHCSSGRPAELDERLGT